MTDVDLPSLLMLVGRGLEDYVVSRLREQGYPTIRVSHGYVFQRLSVATPTISELALDLAITQQGASKSVAELETLGYVERRVAGHDNRVRTVHLTDRGRQAIGAGRAVRAEFLDRLGQAVSAEELAGATRTAEAAASLLGLDQAIEGRSVPLPPQD
jgi:DNA-binding MarR family transcriptional regulator